MKLKLKTRDYIALGVFALFYIGFGAFLVLNQESIVYQPSPQDFENCPGLAHTEKVNHNGTRMYVSNPHKPAVVLYHGNAGSACGRWFYGQIFDQAGYGYLLVEYTGYSNDNQQPTHDAVKRDVENVTSYLEQEQIELAAAVGESIGTGPASIHASKQTPDKLILISPYTDLSDLAASHFWFYPTRLLIDNAYDNNAALATYTNPLLVIHGDQDKVVPHKLGKQLYETAVTPEKTMVTIEGAGHNNLFLYDKTSRALSDFLTNSGSGNN